MASSFLEVFPVYVPAETLLSEGRVAASLSTVRSTPPVVQIDPVKDPRWDDFVRGSHAGTFYHLSAWQEVIRRTYQYTPLHLAVENADGALDGVLPLFLTGNALFGRKLVSLPFCDVGGPLATSRAALEDLVDRAVALRQATGAKYLQIRSSHGNLEEADPRLTADSRYVDYELELSGDADKEWLQPSWAKVRTHVRKALHAGVTVRLAENERDLREFYALHLGTTKKHGMPAQSYRYFLILWETMRLSPNARLLLASQGGQTVAGSLFIAFRDRVSYVYNASDSRFLPFRPNHLLLWKAIEWASKAGYRRFSFGKTSRENEGLVTFKRGWGAEAVPLNYYYHPRIGGTTSSTYGESTEVYQKITHLWRMVPAPITNVVGSLIYGYLA
jgi:FemAB-related protein (PEP-CTERM system-associated)